MNSRYTLSTLKFCQAWIACILAMNGGISLYHATVAAKTGGVGAVGVFITSFLPNAYQNWKSNLVFTFGTTFVGDIIIVPYTLWSCVDGGSCHRTSCLIFRRNDHLHSSSVDANKQLNTLERGPKGPLFYYSSFSQYFFSSL